MSIKFCGTGTFLIQEPRTLFCYWNHTFFKIQSLHRNPILNGPCSDHQLLVLPRVTVTNGHPPDNLVRWCCCLVLLVYFTHARSLILICLRVCFFRYFVVSSSLSNVYLCALFLSNFYGFSVCIGSFEYLLNFEEKIEIHTQTENNSNHLLFKF